MKFEYDIFLSYRHKPLDQEVTREVFNYLESYRLPPTLLAKGYQNISRCFRDTEELPLNRLLTDSIDTALKSTNCLLVICSTDTPSSEWVDREVEKFIELGRADHIYALLLNGDENISCPPTLKLIPDYKERLLDARGKGVRDILERAKPELLRVIAAVVGCEENIFTREHLFYQKRRFHRRAALAGGGFALVLLLSSLLLWMAHRYRQEASKREEASMLILNQLTYELPNKLSNLPGTYARMAGILSDNTRDLNEILLLSRDKEGARHEVAVNYERLATARSTLGMYGEALLAQEKALEILKEEDPKDYASALNNKGNLLYLSSRYEEATASFEKALQLLTGQEEPDLELLAKVYDNAGANAADYGKTDTAIAYFENSLSCLDALTATYEVLSEKAMTSYNVGLLYYRTGQLSKSEAILQEGAQLYRTLLEGEDLPRTRNSFVKCLSALATSEMEQGAYEKAKEHYQEALSLAEPLKEDRENTQSLKTLASLYNNMACCLSSQGDFSGADAYFRPCADLYRDIYEKSRAGADAMGYAISLLNTGENAFKAGDANEAARMFLEGLQYYKGALENLGTYHQAVYYAWLSYYELVIVKNPDLAFEAGLTAYRLQPDISLVMLNLAYACLYSGHEEQGETLLNHLLESGRLEEAVLRQDFQAQQRAGLSCAYVSRYLLEE